MEKVNWLIENFAGDHYVGEMKKALEDNNIGYKIVKYCPFAFDKWMYDKFYLSTECVISWGSLNLICQIQKHTKWIPGYFCNFDNLKCSTYYNYFGEYLFNQDYFFITVGEFERKKDHLFEIFGIHDCIFVRPDNGKKSFVGHIRDKNGQVDKERFLLEDFCEPSDFMVVASPKNIDSEYRMIISERKVITGSKYKVKGSLKIDSAIPQFVQEYTEKICQKEWQPDPMYVMDIAVIDNVPSLLELNCVSCAGFYACDYNKIVLEMSRLALSEWNDFYG